jgi:hypothetical protein
MKRLGITLVSLAAALILSGCFSSVEPLYEEASLTCPIGAETVFGSPTVDAAGAIAHTPAFTIAPDGRACVRTGSNGEPQRLVMAPLGEGWYVAQQYDAERQRYYYGLMRIDGDRFWSYQPNCGDFTQAALEEVGVASPWSGFEDTIAEAVAAGAAADPEAGAPKRAPPGPEASPFAPPVADAASEGEATSDGSCEVTAAAQIESLFRAWIHLGRPADEYGDRMPAQ